jgi:hypothetical protein
VTRSRPLVIHGTLRQRIADRGAGDAAGSVPHTIRRVLKLTCLRWTYCLARGSRGTGWTDTPKPALDPAPVEPPPALSDPKRFIILLTTRQLEVDPGWRARSDTAASTGLCSAPGGMTAPRGSSAACGAVCGSCGEIAGCKAKSFCYMPKMRRHRARRTAERRSRCANSPDAMQASG